MSKYNDYKIRIDFKKLVGAEIVDAERDGEVRKCLLIPLELNGIYTNARHWYGFYKAIRKKPNPQQESHFVMQALSTTIKAKREQIGVEAESIIGSIMPPCYSRPEHEEKKRKKEIEEIMKLLKQ